MGELIINIDKEYQVRYQNYGLYRSKINYFETLQEAEEDYLSKINNPNVSYVEMLECKPLKAYQK